MFEQVEFYQIDICVPQNQVSSWLQARNNESTIIYNAPWAPAPTVIASVSRSLDGGITQPLTVCSINDVSEQLSCDITITP